MLYEVITVRLFAGELVQVATQQHRPGADDYKTQFQEWCQRRFDSLPQYVIVRKSGPDHDKVFEVEVNVGGKSVGRITSYNVCYTKLLRARRIAFLMAFADERP